MSINQISRCHQLTSAPPKSYIGQPVCMDEEDDEQMWWLEEGNNTLMPAEYTYDEYPDIDPNDLVYPDIAPPRAHRMHLQ